MIWTESKKFRSITTFLWQTRGRTCKKKLLNAFQLPSLISFFCLPNHSPSLAIILSTPCHRPYPYSLSPLCTCGCWFRPVRSHELLSIPFHYRPLHRACRFAFFPSPSLRAKHRCSCFRGRVGVTRAETAGIRLEEALLCLSVL